MQSDKFTQLTRLNAGDNSLWSYPSKIEDHPNLIYLNLTGNPLCLIPFSYSTSEPSPHSYLSPFLSLFPFSPSHPSHEDHFHTSEFVV